MIRLVFAALGACLGPALAAGEQVTVYVCRPEVSVVCPASTLPQAARCNLKRELYKYVYTFPNVPPPGAQRRQTYAYDAYLRELKNDPAVANGVAHLANNDLCPSIFGHVDLNTVTPTRVSAVSDNDGSILKIAGLQMRTKPWDFNLYNSAECDIPYNAQCAHKIPLETQSGYQACRPIFTESHLGGNFAGYRFDALSKPNGQLSGYQLTLYADSVNLIHINLGSRVKLTNIGLHMIRDDASEEDRVAVGCDRPQKIERCKSASGTCP
jgi:hypothetical protein